MVAFASCSLHQKKTIDNKNNNSSNNNVDDHDMRSQIYYLQIGTHSLQKKKKRDMGYFDLHLLDFLSQIIKISALTGICIDDDNHVILMTDNVMYADSFNL